MPGLSASFRIYQMVYEGVWESIVVGLKHRTYIFFIVKDLFYLCTTLFVSQCLLIPDAASCVI